MDILITKNLDLDSNEYMQLDRIVLSLHTLIKSNNINPNEILIDEFLISIIPQYTNQFIKKLTKYIKNILKEDNDTIFKKEDYIINNSHVEKHLRKKHGAYNDIFILNKKSLEDIVKLLYDIMTEKIPKSSIKSDDYNQLDRMNATEIIEEFRETYDILNSIKISKKEVLILI